ncbi:MAG: sugar ABC transporter ATP-binding protein [Actinobacteria bacterium]|nr:sugar ABC transporter ATP-binding protein [Actinomycetota bacterium]
MRGITKDFAGGRVLHCVDFDLERGQVHALVGENGAGKSTLMKILAGVYPDYGGEVRIDGNEVSMRTPRTALDSGVAVIYQEFALAPHLSVADNIALGREVGGGLPGGISHRKTKTRSAEEAAALDIELPMDALAGDLSVADQQLTEIVKAVSRHARVLVMDEPTARLSGPERERLFQIIEGLSGRGVGIVYISHFLEEIFAVASQVTVLGDGHRVAAQPLSELDLRQLAKLMVGDKFQEIETTTRRHLEHDAATDEFALALEGLGVAGQMSPTNLRIRRGEVVALAGLQGSGRGALAKAVVGDQAESFGKIKTSSYQGLPGNPLEAMKAGVVMVPADRKAVGLLSVRPVSDNIAVGALTRLARVGVIAPQKRNALVGELVERFHVHPPDPNVEVRALSGGNQQKVILARAVAAEADVLILDQPTAGVDIGAKVELYEQVDALASAGVAILLVSDDLTELLRLSDSIVLVHDGVAAEPVPTSQFDRASLLAAIAGKVQSTT